ALLQRDGRVIAVGNAADLARDAGRAERVDLHGGLMTPGWFDAHVHFMWWGFQMAEIDLRPCRTLEEALAIIGQRARELEPGRLRRGDLARATGSVRARGHRRRVARAGELIRRFQASA